MILQANPSWCEQAYHLFLQYHVDIEHSSMKKFELSDKRKQIFFQLCINEVTSGTSLFRASSMSSWTSGSAFSLIIKDAELCWTASELILKTIFQTIDFVIERFFKRTYERNGLIRLNTDWAWEVVWEFPLWSNGILFSWVTMWLSFATSCSLSAVGE